MYKEKCLMCGAVLEWDIVYENGEVQYAGYKCPDRCMEVNLDHPAYDAILPKTPHCWNCYAEFKRRRETQDGPYGNKCPTCNESLRNHRHFGQGKPGDLALKKSVIYTREYSI